MNLRKLIYSTLAAAALILPSACADDDAVIIFHSQQAEYTIAGDKQLDVTFNGAVIKFDGAKVTVTFGDDGSIASIVINNIIDGHDKVAVGAIYISQAPQGNGIAFAGKMALSETELLVFSGTLIDGKLTLDIEVQPMSAS